MKIIKAGYEILRPWALNDKNREAILDAIEIAARTCYKSEGAIAPGSNAKLVKKLIASGHEAMLEHASMTVCFTVDRGVSHEVVRHRLAAYAQESTRCCNYNKGKFESNVTYIDITNGMSLDPVCLKLPPQKIIEIYDEWISACADAERHYMRMIELGASPQIARSVLNNSTKTELVVTANLREWRLIFALRTASDAHPQMREAMIPLSNELAKWLPEVFGEYEMSKRA